MKRIIAVILMLVTVLCNFSFLAYATDLEASASTDIEAETNGNTKLELETQNILSYSFYYIPESKTVNVKGNMNYDAFAIYDDCSLCIYAIPAGKTEIEVLNDETVKPIAEAPVSISFAFTFKISSIAERYSRYAIFLCTNDGKYILTTEAQYAEIDSDFSVTNDKSSFKGLAADYSSKLSYSNSKATILPIYLDQILTTDASGYIYTADNRQIFFDEEYIESLDAQIRSLSFFGTKVYVQLLLRPGGIIEAYPNADSVYSMPNVFNEQTMLYVHSVTDFLAKRYIGGANGEISGIVIGKAWDNAPKYNAFNGMPFELYVSLCGQYTAIVANAARGANPNLNIVLSFSGNGFYVEQNDNATTDKPLSSPMLIEALMKYFDESSYSGIRCDIIIEAEETPLAITSNELEDGIDYQKLLQDKKFYIGEQNSISTFFNEISMKYKSATEKYQILWISNSELSGNTLSTAYCYAFYATLIDDSITRFYVDFSNTSNNKNLNDILHIVTNIDTENGETVSKNALAYFDKSNWSEVFGVTSLPSYKLQNIYSGNVLYDIPKGVKGSFDYFDFTSLYLTERWIAGVGCTDIKIDYSLTDSKALKVDFSTKSNDFCDLIYYYEYPENISYTPYIQFDFELTDKTSSVYEIRFTFEGDASSYEAKTLLKGNKSGNVVLDMSDVEGFEALRAVKISISALNEDSESCTLWINKIVGHSKEYNSQELTSLIEEERDKQMQKNHADDLSKMRIRYLTVAAIVLVSAFFGVAFMLIIQKNSKAEGKNKKR